MSTDSRVVAAELSLGSAPLNRTPAMISSLTRAAIISVAAVLAACNAVEPVTTYEQVTDPATLYLALTADDPAVNLSTVEPYNTVQLTATPRNALGEPMPGLPAPTFHLLLDSDSDYVKLTSDGRLEAVAATPPNGVAIVIELGVPGGARHIDQVHVSIISDPPPQIASLEVAPPPPDSAKRSMSYVFDPNVQFIFPAAFRSRISRARVLDPDGNAVEGLVIGYRTLNPEIALVERFPFVGNRVMFSATRPGQVAVVAHTFAYGMRLADTVMYTVTWPTLQLIYTMSKLDGTPTFSPSDVRIASSGLVIWENLLPGDSVDVTFDDTTNVADPSLVPGPGATACNTMSNDPGSYGPGPQCGSGNMMLPIGTLAPDGRPIGSTTIQMRQFPVPGVYPYHSTRTGAAGRVIVTDDPDPNALP